MYPKVSEEGSPWFNVHEDRQGAYYRWCSPLYQLSFRINIPFGKSIILVIGETPTTYIYIYIYCGSKIWNNFFKLFLIGSFF